MHRREPALPKFDSASKPMHKAHALHSVAVALLARMESAVIALQNSYHDRSKRLDTLHARALRLQSALGLNDPLHPAEFTDDQLRAVFQVGSLDELAAILTGKLKDFSPTVEAIERRTAATIDDLVDEARRMAKTTPELGLGQTKGTQAVEDQGAEAGGAHPRTLADLRQPIASDSARGEPDPPISTA